MLALALATCMNNDERCSTQRSNASWNVTTYYHPANADRRAGYSYAAGDDDRDA
jgi:hypothetical protein